MRAKSSTMAITPYYLSLIDLDDPYDPIRKMAIPRAEELDYAEQTPDLCGINNRHLGSFVTDVETSFRLAEDLPKEAVKVSESGLSDPLIVKQLRSAGYRGFLMGEHFMKHADPGAALEAFIQQL